MKYLAHKTMWRGVSSIFLTGLLTLLPVVTTVYLIFWIFSSVEAILGGLIRLIMPERYYGPGIGLAAAAVVIFSTGLVMKSWMGRKLFGWGEAVLLRIPLIKTVYGALRDFARFFSRSGEAEKEFRQTVMVPLGDKGMEVMGFVTRTSLEGAGLEVPHEDPVAVYLPMSYQIGGYTVILPRSVLRPVDMPVTEGIRFAVTAGITGRKEG